MPGIYDYVSPEELERLSHTHVEAQLAAGYPISYHDPEYNDEIVREYPDGRRMILHVANDGTTTEVREIPLRPVMCPNRIEKELAQGHWTSYRDPEYPDAVVREYPDGHRMILHVPGDGTMTEVREIPPRKDQAVPDPDADPA